MRIGGVHALAAILAGSTLGLMVGMLGGAWELVLGPLPTVLFVLLLLAFIVADAIGLPAKYLSRPRQVPMAWKHQFPAPMSAALYGASLGFGVLSTAYFWSFHALIAWMFFLASPPQAAMAGAAFGLGRAAPVLLISLVRGPERWERVVDSIGERLVPHAFVLRVASGVSILLLALGGWNRL